MKKNFLYENVTEKMEEEKDIENLTIQKKKSMEKIETENCQENLKKNSEEIMKKNSEIKQNENSEEILKKNSEIKQNENSDIITEKNSDINQKKNSETEENLSDVIKEEISCIIWDKEDLENIEFMEEIININIGVSGYRKVLLVESKENITLQIKLSSGNVFLKFKSISGIYYSDNYRLAKEFSNKIDYFFKKYQKSFKFINF